MINDSLSLTLSSPLFASKPPFKLTTNNEINNNNTPILSDLLNTSPMDMYVPIVLDFNQPALIQNDSLLVTSNNNETSPIICSTKINKRKKAECFKLNYYNLKPSLCVDDYFLVEPEHTHSMELSGSDNCLFLALARSFLSKFYFENKKYEFIIRLFCFNNINSKYNLNSDVNLQQILRKKLCLYWLSFVHVS